MTTPTDKLVEDFAPLLYLEAGILDDKRLAAFLMRAGSHIEHQAAALVAAENEIGRLREPLAILASIWMHGDWLAETPNERLLEEHMTRLGFWPA